MGTNIGFTFILICDTGAKFLKQYVETMRKGLASGDPIILVRTDAVSIEKARVAAHLLARMVNTSLPSGVGIVLLDDHVRIVGLVIEVDAGTDQPFATDANRATWASAFGTADWETFPTPARLQSLEYRDLSLVTISSTHWTSKLEIWIMITEGLGQPKDLANHLILGTSGLIVPRFSASTDSIRSERGLTQWPKQCVLVIHLEYLQIQHVSAQAWSRGDVLSKIISGSDIPRRKLPGVRRWCEFASSFRLCLEKGKPANQLPKWDVQRPEVAKPTEDD